VGDAEGERERSGAKCQIWHGSRRIGVAGAGARGNAGDRGAACGVEHANDNRNRDRSKMEGERQIAGQHWQTVRPSAWSHYDILPCRDGKARRVEAGTFPLADGVPGRMGLLRGYGNAIVPQVAEVFLRAWMDLGRGGPAPQTGEAGEERTERTERR
jgi:DNA (cytosine-5)-methyltransferase 1